MKLRSLQLLYLFVFIAFILTSSCSDSGTSPIQTEIEAELELEFYRIVNGEEDDYFSKSVFLELEGEEYESASGRFEFDDIEHRQYPITVSYREFTFRDTIEIISDYHRFKMGDEFYESIPIQVFEVVEGDTARLQKGGFKSHGNYQDAENRKNFRVYRAHKGDEVNVSIHSPHFETIHLTPIFDTNDIHKFYFVSDELEDISGTVYLTDRGEIYPMQNFEFTGNGRQITTDNNGEFHLDFINAGTSNFIINNEYINEAEITKKIFSFSQPEFELTSPLADFYPLKVGNKWTYDILNIYQIAGEPDSKADFEADWEVLSYSVQNNKTLYEIAETRTGLSIRYWMNDTTYYENVKDTLQIVHYDDDTFEFPEYYGFEENGTVRKTNPSYFEELDIKPCIRNCPSNTPRTILKKGVGVRLFTDFQDGHNRWSKRVELIDYNINN